MTGRELISRRVDPAVTGYILDFWGRISYVWSYDTASPNPRYRPIPQNKSSSLGHCGPANYLLAKGLSNNFPEKDTSVVIYGSVRFAIGGLAIRDHGWAKVRDKSQSVVGDVTFGQLDMLGHWDAVCAMTEAELAEKGILFDGGTELAPAELWEYYTTDPLCLEYGFPERIELLERRLVEEFPETV